MPAGYSGTPLVKKLGIKPGNKILLQNQPSHYFDLLGELPEDIEIENVGNERPFDFIHLFVDDAGILIKSFPELKIRLSKTGMFWVSWPKKSAKIPTDVDGNMVRAIGLENGLVDTKVCAVDETWSGLKFMYRTKDR